jgi:hypothetical protein
MIDEFTRRIMLETEVEAAINDNNQMRDELNAALILLHQLVGFTRNTYELSNPYIYQSYDTYCDDFGETRVGAKVEFDITACMADETLF